MAEGAHGESARLAVADAAQKSTFGAARAGMRGGWTETLNGLSKHLGGMRGT